jgi:hypothetical protein
MRSRDPSRMDVQSSRRSVPPLAGSSRPAKLITGPDGFQNDRRRDRCVCSALHLVPGLFAVTWTLSSVFVSRRLSEQTALVSAPPFEDERSIRPASEHTARATRGRRVFGAGEGFSALREQSAAVAVRLFRDNQNGLRPGRTSARAQSRCRAPGRSRARTDPTLPLGEWAFSAVLFP